MAFLDLSDIDTPGYRAIAPDLSGFNLVAEVTVNEDHEDTMIITEHPVEAGAQMSDHAYIQPPEVRLRVGWSNGFGGYTSYAQDVYAQVLDLQRRRKLFEVFTAKRWYKNVLVASIRETTDERTEFSFLAEIQFRQVFLSQTQTTAAKGQSSQPGNQGDQTKTAPTVDRGQAQVQSSLGVTAGGSVTGSFTEGDSASASAGIGTPNSDGGGANTNTQVTVDPFKEGF